MLFNYFEVLSGEPLLMQGVGHLKSPKLKEIYPYSGIGIDVYNFYLALLTWDKDAVLEYSTKLHLRNAEKLKIDELNAFDVIMLQREMREPFIEMLSFFIVETLIWSQADRCVSVLAKQGGDDESEMVPIGRITRSNFEEVRKRILQLNFIGLGDDVAEKQQSFENEKAKELWEKAMQYKEKLKNKKKKDEDGYHEIGNIVSKLCSLSNGYNYLNVFELTIFQLYDAFYQMSYMRSVGLSEKIYSQHGGDHFKYEDWLKPIISTKRRT